MSETRKRAYLYLLLVAVIWGAAGPIAKYTLGALPPLTFLAYRFLLSGIFAFIYILAKGVKIPNLVKNLPSVILYGLLSFTFALSLLFYGLERSTVLELTLLGAAGPLVVTAGGYFFFRDRITSREKLGIAIALAGVLINSVLPLFLHTETVLQFSGNIFLILFLLVDSSAVLWGKELLKKGIPSLSITMVGFLVAALTIVPFAYFMEGPQVITQIAQIPLQYHLGVWYMAFFSGIIAYFLAIQGSKSIEISEAWLFMYLQPLFSIPLAVFWLGESLTVSFVVGALIIALGVYIAETRARK